jgi:hypothetical protein
MRAPERLLAEYFANGQFALPEQLSAIVAEISAAGAAVAQWPERFATIDTLARTIGAGVLGDLRNRILPEKVRALGAQLLATVPSAVSLATTVADYLHAAPARQASRAADALATTDASEILHGIDDPPEARVELARTGWRPGDHVTVRVRFLARDSAGSERVLQEQSYAVRAEVLGARREVTSSMVFARALSGPASVVRRWEANVGAILTWHYRFRAPNTVLKRLANSFDPGLGIHLASLDQGTDRVEFGIGGSVTLWGGLLTGGVGYNLSQENTYALVGIDLFDVLNRTAR